MYKCSNCGLGIIVYNLDGKLLEKPIKACSCKASIVVNMESVVEGKSYLSSTKKQLSTIPQV
jgi:hypothetical protein